MTTAFTDRCLDRYARDDKDSIRIELAATPGVVESDLLEQAAEAHREQARRLTRRAWEMRPVPDVREGRGW